MTKTIIGIFAERNNAEDAIRELESLNFNPKDISIIMKDRDEAHHIATNTGTSPVVDGAATGAATGGLVGGIAGLLVGIGAIAIPGLGAILIGGPIAAALGISGAAATTLSGAVTGVIAGGLVGALMGLGIPEEDARIYEERIQEGGILVAVPAILHTEDEIKDILHSNGADQIRILDTSTAEKYEEDIVDEDFVDTHSYPTDYPSAYAGMKGGRARRIRQRHSDI